MILVWSLSTEVAGLQRVEQPDGTAYDAAEIAYGVPLDQLQDVPPEKLLTEVTVAVLNKDLHAVVAEENAALAAIGMTTLTVEGALARTVKRRTQSRTRQRP